MAPPASEIDHLLSLLSRTSTATTERHTPPLPGIAAIVGRLPEISALPHVVSTVSAFLEPSEAAKALRSVFARDQTGLDARVHQIPGCSDRAERNRHWEKLKWSMTVVVADEAVSLAAARGDLRMLKRLHGEFEWASFGEVMWQAAAHGHLEVLRWLQPQSSKRQQSGDDVVSDAVFGCHAPSDETLLTLAESNGHLEVAKWIVGEADKWARSLLGHHRDEGIGAREGDGDGRAAGLEVATYDCHVTEAAGRGHLHVLEWLTTARAQYPWLHLTDVFSLHTFHNFRVVEWLSETFGYSTQFTSGLMNAAVAEDHLELLRGMYIGHQVLLPPTTLMDTAAEHGHLDIVCWLHERG